MRADTVLFPFPVVLLALLISGAAAPASASESWGGGVRRVEVPAAPSGDEPQVRVSPGLSTTFLFDSEVQVVELDEREGFALVDAGHTVLRLVPSEQLAPGTRLRCTVRFKDGAAPASAAFVLVIHPAQAESLVEVYRRKRTVESYREEANEAREEVRQCRERIERLEAEYKGAGGLRGLLATRVIDKKGVPALDLLRSVIRSPVSEFGFVEATSYRSATRVALALSLTNPEGWEPWMAEGATLSNKQGETLRVLPLWQEAPETFGSFYRVVVEAEASIEDARGSYTLKLWDAGGKRTVILGNVTFPALP